MSTNSTKSTGTIAPSNEAVDNQKPAQLNLKQASFFKHLIATGNATRSYMRTYGQKNPVLAASAASQLINKYKGVNAALLDKHGLTLDQIALRIKDALSATYVTKTKSGQIREAIDYKTRLRAVEIAMRLLGLDKHQEVHSVNNVVIFKDPEKGIFSIQEATDGELI